MNTEFTKCSAGQSLSASRKASRNILLLMLFIYLFTGGRYAFAAKEPCDCENPAARTRVEKYTEYWRLKLQGLPTYSQRITVTGSLNKMVSSDEFLGLSQLDGGWAKLEKDGESFIASISPYALKELAQRGVSVDILDDDTEPVIESVPVNDDCINAQEVDVNEPVVGSTAEAAGADVWYRFTPSVSGNYMITLAGSDYDTQLWVYETCDGPYIAYDDDGGPGLTSQLIIDLQSDVTYYIRIGGFLSQTGTYQLEIQDASDMPCYHAAPVEVDTLVTGSTIDAAETGVFFSFTPTMEGNYCISLAGSDYDTQLWVYDQCYGQVLAYNDDFGFGMTSQVVLHLSPDPVIIRIDGYLGSTGNYQMMITYYPAPRNDDCDAAMTIAAGQVFEGSTSGAIDFDVWYAFTPTQTGPVILSLLGSDFDTVLTVWDNCDGSIIAENDDSYDFQSRLSMEMIGGHTYFIQVGGFYGSSGNYRLTAAPVPTPPHDTAPDAIEIGFDLPYSGTTDGASTSLNRSICGYYDGLDVWHTFTPQAGGVVKIDVEGDMFDSTLSVYDRFGGPTLACCEYTCSPDPNVIMHMTGGVTYLIRVAGTSMTTGAYRISVSPYSDSALQVPADPSPADASCNIPVDTVLTWNGITPIESSICSNQQPAKPGNSDDISIMSIFGLDDRLEEYEIADSNALDIGNSTAILIDRELLTINQDGGCTIDAPTLAEYIEYIYGIQLSDGESFRDQPTIGFCSAFLVSPDVIATAGHCVPCEDLARMAVIFDFTMIDVNTPVVTLGPESVYFGAEYVASQQNEPDWGLVRLDRRVEGRMPLRLRRQGIVPERQPLVVVGHPLGIPRKYDFGGKVRDNWMSTYFSANLDVFGGSSGSAVLNADTWEVEGILVRGVGDFVLTDDFLIESLVLPDDGPYAQEVTRTSTFADFVGSYEVYMGTDPSAMVLVDSGGAISQCRICGLQGQTTYYWQVVGVGHSARVPGPVWSFTTE